ncbi:MAG: glycosyltransferase [Chroococcales cyanobacterium]
MPNNSWNDAEEQLNPLSSLLPDWTDPEDEEEEFRSDFFLGLEGRRRKAALVMMSVWGVTIGLHLVSWGLWVVLSLTAILLIYITRLFLTEPPATPQPLSENQLADAPSVSLLVSAKNEEAVISKLVKMLCNLDYPEDKYEVWVIDDYSTDQTPQLLDKLAQEYPQLNVLHRPANAGGGKCGALNQVLPLTKGDIIGVFDADATVTKDLLRQVVPLFDPESMGAVQVRKAIANPHENFWTKGQVIEMALDSYFQQQRIASGGIGELRGNGQFVRRQALDSCGGWNEQTITDDLDLTVRLHLDNWEIGFLQFPAVEEEGVTKAIALWHQRSRWAEGGFQRYLDYWRWIANNRLPFTKSVDLLMFVLIQYLLPTAMIPDTIMAVSHHHFPILMPLTTTVFSLSFVGMVTGLRRTRQDTELSLFEVLKQTIPAMLYMSHWFLVMPTTTTRMSIRPKRLKWVKTVHQGTAEEGFEF